MEFDINLLDNEVVFFLQPSLLFAFDLSSSPDVEIDEHLNPSQFGGSQGRPNVVVEIRNLPTVEDRNQLSVHHFFETVMQRHIQNDAAAFYRCGFCQQDVVETDH